MNPLHWLFAGIIGVTATTCQLPRPSDDVAVDVSAYRPGARSGRSPGGFSALHPLAHCGRRARRAGSPVAGGPAADRGAGHREVDRWTERPPPPEGQPRDLPDRRHPRPERAGLERLLRQPAAPAARDLRRRARAEESPRREPGPSRHGPLSTASRRDRSAATCASPSTRAAGWSTPRPSSPPRRMPAPSSTTPA